MSGVVWGRNARRIAAASERAAQEPPAPEPWLTPEKRAEMEALLRTWAIKDGLTKLPAIAELEALAAKHFEGTADLKVFFVGYLEGLQKGVEVQCEYSNKQLRSAVTYRPRSGIGNLWGLLG